MLDEEQGYGEDVAAKAALYGIDIEDVTEEELKLLMQLGIIPSQLEQATGELEGLREDMRYDTPEGRQAGKIYVAANPLEHLGEFTSNLSAGYERKKTQALIDELRRKQAQGRETFYNSLSGRSAAQRQSGPF
jgi:hypothetical protein